MNKTDVLREIERQGIVAVVRADSEQQALSICDACVAGGVTTLELTFTVPNAEKVIAALGERYAGQILLGAGTVMNVESAETALESGAKFIVSPYFDEAIVAFCVKNGTAVIPGIMTVREAVLAMKSGADVLKVFPAELFGPAIIKALHGPLPNTRLMPTGGVNADNVGEWIRAGAVAVGAGSSLTAGAELGDYDRITETAKKFIKNIKSARCRN